MKKLTLFTLLFALVLCFSSCGKWNQPNPDMPDNVREGHEEVLQENLDTLGEDPDDLEAIFEVAFRYHMLGNYKEAKEYYDMCLEQNPNHTVALNNLADMLEEIEEYEMAAEYIKLLYPLEPDSSQVIKDTVRILLKANDSHNAQLALENYVALMEGKSEDGVLDESMQLLISNLFNDIVEYNQASEEASQ